MSKTRPTKDELDYQRELEKKYINITEDGCVRKLIIVEGDGLIPKEGEEVAVHYNATLDDGTVVGDTFEKKVPLKLTIGGEASIRGIELAIATMRYGEKAYVEVSPLYAFGKMDNPYGFHGYGVRIPPDSKLNFELHLLPVELAIPKSTNQWIEQAEANKAAGNKAFEEKNDEVAKTEYDKVLKILESIKQQLLHPLELEGRAIEEKNKLQDERKEYETKYKSLYIATYSNLAAVCLRMKKYDDAKQHCKKVLEQDSKNVKALFRLAMVHKAFDQFELAIDRLNEASWIQSSKDIQKELTECKKLHSDKLEREKGVYKGIFSQLKEGESLYEGVEPGKPERWKCHYCDEEMDQIQQARHIIKFHSGQKKEKITNKDLGLPDQIPLDFKAEI